jgi:hypothetical protein
MLVIHRLIKHETMKYNTMVGVEKVKDMDTGGKHTGLDEQVLCSWNSGLGFEVYGVNPIKDLRIPKNNDLPF